MSYYICSYCNGTGCPACLQGLSSNNPPDFSSFDTVSNHNLQAGVKRIPIYQLRYPAGSIFEAPAGMSYQDAIAYYKNHLKNSKPDK